MKKDKQMVVRVFDLDGNEFSKDSELKFDITRVPKAALESFCSAIREDIIKSYQDPEFCAKFEEWKAERDKASKSIMNGT